MKKLILFVFVVYTATVIHAQGVADSKKYSHFIKEAELLTHSLVIASSGLKLRETPSAEGKVLVMMPLGAKVKLEESLSDVDENRYFQIAENYSSCWLSVTYNGKKGYCCAAYLGKRILKMTNNYYFTTPYEGCGQGTVHLDPAYYTYGVFSEGEKKELKSIKVEYFNNGESINLRCLSDEEQPDYIIFAKYQMKIGIIKGKNHNSEQNESLIAAMDYEGKIEIQQKIVLDNKKYEISSKIIKNVTKESETEFVQQLSLIEKSTGTKYNLGTFAHQAIRVEWSGDLDGDGKMDLILEASGEMYSSRIFLLSRNAPNGKILIEEGSIDSYDCC
jgi:hypothetical protein